MSDAARITTILTILMCDGWLGSLPGCAAVKVVNADDGALSRFAHFEAATNAGATAGVKACLGDTFATGLATQVVARNSTESANDVTALLMAAPGKIHPYRSSA